jgi:triosephosphate isomerase
VTASTTSPRSRSRCSLRSPTCAACRPWSTRTSSISPAFLAKLGVTYVAVGHSERRQYHDESDELINKKVLNALSSGIVPILCVGEVLEVRKAGEHVPHTLAQLDGALTGLTAEQVKTIVVAYEPVWAIGTGETATPEDAQELCAAIRARIAELYDAGTADAVRVLYGGSVKSSNVASIMAKPDVDGALVGGASLDPDEFAAIARYQSHAVGL